MKKYLYRLFSLVTLVFFLKTSAQDLGTKVVDVVKAYSPTIADATKNREEDPIEDSLTLTKKEIEYTIFSVPVASTFVPEKGKAMRMPTERKSSYNNSYVGFGGGTYGTLLADTYIHIPIDRENSVFIVGEHYSSQGGIKEVSKKIIFQIPRLKQDTNKTIETCNGLSMQMVNTDSITGMELNLVYIVKHF